MRFRLGFAIAFVPMLALASTLDISGGAELTTTTIDFNPALAGPPVNGTGTANVTSATGVFAGGPSAVSIVDRTIPSQQAGVPIFIMNWMQAGNWSLDLKDIRPGLFPSALCGPPVAVGQTCTPAAPPPFVSPFEFENYSDAGQIVSRATMRVSGVIRESGDNTELAPFQVDFVFEFDRSYQDVLASIASNGGTGSVETSYTATMETDLEPEPEPTPEPSTGALVLGGVGIAIWRRKHLFQ